MINVNTIYVKTQNLIAKATGGGFLNPDEYNNYSAMSSLDLFNELMVVYQRTQKVTDMIRYFITTKQLISDDYGKVSYPSDYRYMITAPRTYERKAFLELTKDCEILTPLDYAKLPQVEVKVIDNDKLANRMSSEIFRPSPELPIVTLYDTYIQVRPFDTGYLILDYLKAPVAPIWAFTISPTTGLPVYDAANSVNFDWSPVAENKLIMKICQYFGLEVRESELYSASQQLNAQDTV